MLLSNEKSTTVATINKQKIVILNKDGQEFVPVRPICDALGIDPDSQLKRLKRDRILNSTTVTMTVVGADEKQREMVAIPLRYVFGWLFTIDANLVKDEIKETVVAYQKQCYDALFDYFSSFSDYVKKRSEMIEEAVHMKEVVRMEFNTAKDRLKDADEDLREAMKYNYSDYLTSKAQLSLNFEPADVVSTEDTVHVVASGDIN